MKNKFWFLILSVSLAALSLALAGCDTGSSSTGNGDPPPPLSQTQYALDWAVFPGNFKTVFDQALVGAGVGSFVEHKTGGITIGYSVKGAKATQVFNWVKNQGYNIQDGEEKKPGTLSELIDYGEDVGMPSGIKSAIKEADLPIAGIVDGGSGYAAVFYIRNLQAQYTLEVAVFNSMSYNSFYLQATQTGGYNPDSGDFDTTWSVVKGANASQAYTSLYPIFSSYMPEHTAIIEGTFSELVGYKYNNIGLPQGLKNKITANDKPIVGIFEPEPNYVSAFYLHQ